MRLPPFLGIAGLLGWLWFGSGSRDEPVPTAAHARRQADLSSLQAQVAVARATSDIATDRADDPPTGDGRDDTDARDGDLSGLAAQVAAADELEPADESEPADEAIEVQLADVVGHEVIRIVAHAPMIDPGSVSRCHVVHDEYVVHIPALRTFEGVLVEVTDETSEVSFSGGTPIENEYVVEGD